MPKTIIGVDLTNAPRERDPLPHNRWHPDVPVVASVKSGEEFRVETIDWTGGQIKNDDSANDVRDCDLICCHHLLGPIEVRGASREISWWSTSSTWARIAVTSGVMPDSSRSRTAADFSEELVAQHLSV